MWYSSIIHHEQLQKNAFKSICIYMEQSLIFVYKFNLIIFFSYHRWSYYLLVCILETLYLFDLIFLLYLFAVDRSSIAVGDNRFFRWLYWCHSQTSQTIFYLKKLQPEYFDRFNRKSALEFFFFTFFLAGLLYFKPILTLGFFLSHYICSHRLNQVWSIVKRLHKTKKKWFE